MTNDELVNTINILKSKYKKIKIQPTTTISVLEDRVEELVDQVKGVKSE